MFRMTHNLPLTLAAALPLALGAGAGDAAIVEFASDAAFNNQFAPSFSKTFGVQTREGASGTTGDWETGIIRPDFTTYTQGQADWTSDDTHDFSFEMSNAGLVSHTITELDSATTGLTASPTNATAANTIAIRARTGTKDSNGNSDGTVASTLSNLQLTIDNIVFDLGTATSLAGDNDAQYIVLTGLDLTSGFDLSGNATFDVGAFQSGGSRVMYEIKVGVYEEEPSPPAGVPTPPTLALLGAGLVGLGIRRLRLRH